jgi:hypothetical protein
MIWTDFLVWPQSSKEADIHRTRAESIESIVQGCLNLNSRFSVTCILLGIIGSASHSAWNTRCLRESEPPYGFRYTTDSASASSYIANLNAIDRRGPVQDSGGLPGRTQPSPIQYVGMTAGARASLVAYQLRVPFRPADDGMKSILEREGYCRLKISKSKAGYLCLAGKVNGKIINLMIDTGAPNTHLDRKRTENVSLQWQRAHAKTGKAPYDFCYVSTIEFEAFRTGKLLVYNHDLTEINSRLKAIEEGPLDGVLGADILDPHKALIDYKASCLYLMGDQD